jgi:response regulator RpfG family c-di-GMP phosphodiesterase
MRLSDTPPGGCQILIAEDEAMFRDAAVEALKAGGFEVFQAGDGEEALALLKEHPHISLLISDVRMPYMDGYALGDVPINGIPFFGEQCFKPPTLGGLNGAV